MSHESVLLQEVLDGLTVRRGETFVDGTVNGGGHSMAVCGLLGRTGTLVGMDLDLDALARARKRLAHCDARVHLIQSNFRRLAEVLASLGIEGADRILFDFGLSSDQLESSGRGFSFRKDEPLTMTLAKEPAEGDVTAATIVNDWNEETVANIIHGYGEERYSRKIAHAIVLERERTRIERTGQLVRIIDAAVPPRYRHGPIHPATRTFQALRIAVNDELSSIRDALASSLAVLRVGGRVAAISFHSLEDRIVKRSFQAFAAAGRGIQVTKKPIVPSDAEVERNPRSRSAKLRIFQKHA